MEINLTDTYHVVIVDSKKLNLKKGDLEKYVVDSLSKEIHYQINTSRIQDLEVNFSIRTERSL